jgi:hypothetical protein
MIAIPAGPYTFVFDPERLSNAYGVYAIRLSQMGTLEGLVAKPEAAEWEDLTDLPLVSVATTQARPRRN